MLNLDECTKYVRQTEFDDHVCGIHRNSSSPILMYYPGHVQKYEASCFKDNTVSPLLGCMGPVGFFLRFLKDTSKR